jgi:hypothetical protein
LEHYLEILHGDAAADAQGTEVFKHLKQLVLDRKPMLAGAA